MTSSINELSRVLDLHPTRRRHLMVTVSILTIPYVGQGSPGMYGTDEEALWDIVRVLLEAAKGIAGCQCHTNAMHL